MDVCGDDVLARICALKAEQSALRAQKKSITKDLRNAERRRKRLKKKAKQLSDTDLVAVLRMRQQMSTARSSTDTGPAEGDAAIVVEHPPAQSEEPSNEE